MVWLLLRWMMSTPKPVPESRPEHASLLVKVVCVWGGRGTRWSSHSIGLTRPGRWTLHDVLLIRARFCLQIRSLMAAMTGRPKLALGSSDFASFFEYYNLLRKKDKDQAARFADKRSKN